MQPQHLGSCEEVTAAMPGWDLELRPQEAGGARLWSHAGARGAVNWVGFDGRVHQLGAPPANQHTIGILTAEDYPLRWNGRLVSAGTVEVFAPGGEYESCGGGAFGAFTLSIERSHVDRMAQMLGVPPLSALTGDKAWVGHPQSLVPLQRIKVQMSSCHLHEDPDAAMDDVAETMLLMLQEVSQQRGSLPRRRQVFRRALAVIRELPAGENTSIGDLCAWVGCSFSTLQRAFRDQVGVGPKAYLLAHRLNRVRGELQGAGFEDRVVDIANRWGFWHMGQFAADYRQLFGELPSETLQRPPRAWRSAPEVSLS